MTKTELVLERLHRNGVLSPFPSADQCVRGLAGVQSQIQQFAELAVFNRCSPAPSMQSLENAYRSHSLINLWGQRNTLHTYAARDWDMICDVYHDRTYHQSQLLAHPAFFTQVAKQIQTAAAGGRPVERAQIEAFITERAPKSLESPELTYIVQRYLCANGLLFGIPAKPSIRQFACFPALGRARWQRSAGNVAASLEELLRRYFQHYGPATVQDFSYWSGLPIAAFREAFDRLASRLKKITNDQRAYYAFGNVEVKNARKLSLLGKFDPLFVAYRHKDWIATPEQQKQIWRSAGHVEAVILDGATLTGTWRHVLKGGRMTICVEPMAAISEATKKRIETKAQNLARFWKKELGGVTYR